MMQIIQEIKELRSNEKTTQEILKDFAEQQVELINKIHLFKVIEIASDVEKLTSNKIFEKFHIKKIALSYCHDYDMGNQLDFILYVSNTESEKNEVFKYDSHGNYIEPVEKLKKSFRNLDGLNTYNLSEDFRCQNTVSLAIDDSLADKVLNLLLSKELRASLNHAELQIQIQDSAENNTEKKSTRPKI